MHRNAQVAVKPSDGEEGRHDRRRLVWNPLDTVKARQISLLAVGKFELLL